MGHLVAKNSYDRLRRKLDGLTVRVPDHPALRELLSELYAPADAALVADMPYGLATSARIAASLELPRHQVQARLDALADRGLVLDLTSTRDATRYYMASPLVIGVFEFTMMRAGPAAEHAHRARLFHEYLETGLFQAKNFGAGEQVSVLRTLAHEGTIESSTEVLDYQSARAIIEGHSKFSVGVCSCRHEREHLGARHCRTPLATCTAFGSSAEYLVGHGLARASSREEMLEILRRSRSEGLVLSADNVRRGASFLCHCCSCCCNMLQGLTRFGHPAAVVTSGFEAALDPSACSGCDRCVSACPVGAIRGQRGTERRPPHVDGEACIGCGVCATRCARGAVRLVPGHKRQILPENTFERVLLQCLERGTLQNLVFDDPCSGTQAAMRWVLGGFLRLRPVKRALVSDALRSRFLSALSRGASSDVASAL